MFCLHVCICTRFVPDAHRGQKTTLDSFNLKLIESICVDSVEIVDRYTEFLHTPLTHFVGPTDTRDKAKPYFIPILSFIFVLFVFKWSEKSHHLNVLYP